MAPSRPLLNSKLRSMSEPNLPECLLREQRVEQSPELDLSFHNEDEDSSHDNLTKVIPLKSFSQLPKQLRVDKERNIKNFLASLPSLQTIDDDQGLGENTYTSESGSGSSSPILTPTDDEQFHLKYKLAKEIKDEKNSEESHSKPDMIREDAETGETESSPIEMSGGYDSQSSNQVPEKAPSLQQASVSGIPPKPAPPAITRPTKSKVSPPPDSSSVTTPMTAHVRQPIAVAKQLTYKIVPSAMKTASLPHNLALATLPSPKLAAISPQSSKVSLASMASTSALPEEDVDGGDDQAEEAIMITVTDSKNDIVQDQPTNELPTPTRAKEHEGHARQSSDGALLIMSAPSCGAEMVTWDAGNQHRRAKSDGDDISGPTQIPSVPDRVKEIEEMNVLSGTQEGLSINHARAPSPVDICKSITPDSEDKQQGIASASSLDDKQLGDGYTSTSDDKHPSIGSTSNSDNKQQSVGSMSRTSSNHSLLSSSHDAELEGFEQSSVKSGSPCCIRSTRHGSLSPNPPSLQMKMVTEQTRCASLMHLPQDEQGPHQQQKYELNDENLACSRMGAVKAIVQDIEEKNKDGSVSVRSKASPEKSETSSKVTPPLMKAVQRPSSTVASGTNDDGDDVCVEPVPLVSVRRHSTTTPQLRPSGGVFVEDESGLSSAGQPRMGRRESTPPALFSAWSQFIPVDDIPKNPVQDLKQKFEDSTKESKALSKSTEAHPRTLDALKAGSNLRRSQSLKSVSSLSGNSSYRRKRKKPSYENFTPISDSCSQDSACSGN